MLGSAPKPTCRGGGGELEGGGGVRWLGLGLGWGWGYFRRGRVCSVTASCPHGLDSRRSAACSTQLPMHTLAGGLEAGDAHALRPGAHILDAAVMDGAAIRLKVQRRRVVVDGLHHWEATPHGALQHAGQGLHRSWAGCSTRSGRRWPAAAVGRGCAVPGRRSLLVLELSD